MAYQKKIFICYEKLNYISLNLIYLAFMIAFAVFLNLIYSSAATAQLPNQNIQQQNNINQASTRDFLVQDSQGNQRILKLSQGAVVNNQQQPAPQGYIYIDPATGQRYYVIPPGAGQAQQYWQPIGRNNNIQPQRRATTNNPNDMTTEPYDVHEEFLYMGD